MSKDEEEEREEALAEVADPPMFLMHRGDADADGDIEVDDGTGGHMADLYISVLNTLLILPQSDMIILVRYSAHSGNSSTTL